MRTPLPVGPPMLGSMSTFALGAFPSTGWIIGKIVPGMSSHPSAGHAYALQLGASSPA